MNDLSVESEFFAPSCTDMIDGLIGQYRTMLAKLEHIAGIFTGDMASAVGYFIDGNKQDRYGGMNAERLFKLEGAVAALNSAYWSKTLALTDVLDCMPQKRRDEWYKQIQEQTSPDFTEDTVRATITGLLDMRMQFLSERVDGLFKSLSREHVTNCPAAFGKRMIIADVLNEYCSEQYRTAGHINDLRAIIAKFTGRGEPDYRASSTLIQSLKGRWGEWVPVDGNALRIRLYKKGTAHMEIHPEISYRLNQILAHLYPSAIPAEFRRKPVKSAKKLKEFEMMIRPLPFPVLNLLDAARPRKGEMGVRLDETKNKTAESEARRVLQSIGGVLQSSGSYLFDYWPGDVIEEICVSGGIPDQKTHQFYPTPENVALAAIELAEIRPRDYCLEPSAGQGGLADFMPKDRTTCIEISALHCKILTEKGFATMQGDFLSLTKVAGKFDRIVMNPPFSDGRAEAHVKAAALQVQKGGRLIAILPSSHRGKISLDGFGITWSRDYSNEFSGTSVSVVIMCAVSA